MEPRTAGFVASATPDAVALRLGINIALSMEDGVARASRRLDFYLLVCGSAENLSPVAESDAKSTTQLYPTLTEEFDTMSNKKSPTLSKSSTMEMPNSVDTLVLRSAGKYAKSHECITLDNLAPGRMDGLDSVSLLSIESAVFFDDHERRVDFILVYSTDTPELTDHHLDARKIFENNLKDEGLELEHNYQAEMGLVFVKMHAPWEVLSRYGEILKFKMPMKELNEQENFLMFLKEI
ncbi:anoctamin [Trichonephila clavipes]|nr:anoctamin [Trichonephila clavipes]